MSLSRPDLARELSRLKDFQRDTVEHVFARMYPEDGAVAQRRFLVADEVGLGKTMVARGLVAKAIDHLWDEVDRIDIAYICSNASIARQNINRLNVSDAKDASLPSRITLLPTVVRGLKHRKLNFISLTPQTSFDLRSSLGTYPERALLFWLLPDEWKPSAAATRNLLQGGADRDAFRRRVTEFEREQIDPELQDHFRQQLATRPDLRERFVDAVERFGTWRQVLPEADRALQREMVGTLRLELAVSCLGALEPDLIILDEFQRFKHLLDGTDQSSALAQELFNFGEARVLLLSATPYKMYTLADEAQNDDHFRDFLQTVSFLQADRDKTEAFKRDLDAYREGLFALGNGGESSGPEARAAVERSLRQIMVRTERLAASADRNGMLKELTIPVPLEAADVGAYLAYSQVSTALDQGEVIEYWKSAPFLFNFMERYQLKSAFEEAIARPGTAIKDALSRSPKALLNWDDVERYQPLDPANARLRHLMADTIGRSAWRLLWLPPALPYYRPAGPFADAQASHAGKRLIFSSWQVVPKVVAAVLTYEAERHMFGDRPNVARPNSLEERARFRPLLRFARTEGRLTGMPITALLYPSMALAALGDPLDIVRSTEQGPSVTVDEVVEAVASRLGPLLADLADIGHDAGGPDQAWYWAAPGLLDMARHPGPAAAWFQQESLADLWKGEGNEAEGSEEAGDGASGDAWREHVAEFVRGASRQVRLGAQPRDLPEVIARLAIAGPGVVALRALSRMCGGNEALCDRPIRNSAAAIAWGFRTLFNVPEATAMIRRDAAEERYWQSVLDYCLDGGLQSVMDEYVHVLQEAEGVAHRPYRRAAKVVAARIAAALQLRTVSLGVHEISIADSRVDLADRRMRARFAARFGGRQDDEGASAVRADDVRAAFNSPFWPFVLCSTSVGQEGLDFHLYCHAVMHWNLPSNPVDLEQREGRVHRFKGHAIRKNVAKLYGAQALMSSKADPWQAAFEAAAEARGDDWSELVPYWILSADGGARIERHVPLLPLSREIGRLEALRRTLTVYRMAFGQNRQDDIVAYLLDRFSADEIESLSESLRINLAPDRTSGAQQFARPREWQRSLGDEHDDAAPVHVPDATSSPISLHAAVSLLDAYVVRRDAERRPGVEEYRGLLDRFVALRN